MPAQRPASEAGPQPDVFAAPDAADRALSSALRTWTDPVLDVFESRAVRPVPAKGDAPAA